MGQPFDAWRDVSDRVRATYGGIGDETCGVFIVRVPGTGAVLRVIASCGEGWDHVSVSRPSRCPTWEEMSFVKRAFFRDDEWAIEYHPPIKENISVHDFCLHLWRLQGGVMPIPPPWTVGI